MALSEATSNFGPPPFSTQAHLYVDVFYAEIVYYKKSQLS